MNERRLTTRNAILVVYCDALAASGLADPGGSDLFLPAPSCPGSANGEGSPPHHACLSSTPVTYADLWASTVALNLPKAVTL